MKKQINSFIAAIISVSLLLALCSCAGQGSDNSQNSYTVLSSLQSKVESVTSEKSEVSSEISASEESSEITSEESSASSKVEGTTPPSITGAIPESAKVDKSYFDDAVFIGDSVSLKLNYYCTANGALGNASFLTSGSLGSGNALRSIDDEDSVHPSYKGEKMLIEDGVAACGAKKAYIMLGMNDIGLYGIEKSIENYIELIHRIEAKSPGITIIIQSMTPMTSTSYFVNNKGLNNKNIGIYNEKLSEVAAENGWYFLDVQSVLHDEDGFLPREYCSDPDEMGIHFTGKGCEAWVEYLLTHTI